MESAALHENYKLGSVVKKNLPQADQVKLFETEEQQGIRKATEVA